MTEATNRNIQRWLIMLLVFSIFVSFPFIIIAQTSQPDSRLSILLDSAEILKLKGFYNKSDDVITKIAKEAKQIEDWLYYSKSLIEKADIIRFKEYFKRDQQALAQALNLLEESKEYLIRNFDIHHVALLRYYLYKGKIIRMTYGSDSALTYFNKAMEISDLHDTNYKERAKVLYELARQYNLLGRTNEADEYYTELLKIVSGNFEEYSFFKALYCFRIGRFYQSIGDLERSRLCLSIAIDIFNHPIHRDLKNLIRAENSLANNLFYSNEESNNALNHYQRVVDLAKSIGESENRNLVRALTNSAHILYRVNKLDSSLLLSRKSLSKNGKETSGDSIMLSYAYRDQGMALLLKKDYDGAIYNLQMSTQIINKVIGRKGFYTYVIHHDIGQSYMKIGQYETALKYFQKGLIALFEKFNSIDIFHNPNFSSHENREQIFYILFNKADALYNQFLITDDIMYLEKAYSMYVEGYHLFSRILDSGFMEESISQLFLEFKDEFSTSIECALTMYQHSKEIQYFEKALEFVEQSKYFLLAQSQLNAQLKELTGDSSNIFVEERSLARQINELKHEISIIDVGKKQKIFSKKNKLLSLLIEKKKVRENIFALRVESAKKHIVVPEFSLDEVRKKVLTDNEIIIEYHTTKEKIIALIIGNDFVDFKRIPFSTKLNQSMQTYIDLISGNEYNGDPQSDYKFYLESSYYIFNTIIKPALDKAKEYFISANPTIIIIPEGLLSYLPIESLTTEFVKSSDINYWSLPYVIKEYKIRYAYSLNVLIGNLIRRTETNKYNILAFSYSSRFDDNADISKLRNENELPYSGAEIQRIKNIFGGRHYYEGLEATEELFKSNASDFSLLHLALHGSADKYDKFNSRLLFKSQSNLTEDGILHAYELYSLDLSNTQLAVLSACETGIGVEMEGEGIFSMARSFSYAGCPSIVMSLWKVNDKSTADLMEHYYSNLSVNMDKATAMQKAKLDYIDGAEDINSNPKNWAAFIQLGNTRPIDLPVQKSSIWIYVLAGLAVTAFVLIYFRISRNHKSKLLF